MRGREGGERSGEEDDSPHVARKMKEMGNREANRESVGVGF